MNTATKLHVFEAAGLGHGPYKVVRVERRVGPIRKEVNGITYEAGSPGQPMGTCDYCNNGIANCFIVQDRDGNEFTIGSECVRKTGDTGLKRVVDEHAAADRKGKEAEKRAKLWAWFEENKTAIALRPEKWNGRPLVESMEWYRRNAGASGQMRILKYAKDLLEGKATRYYRLPGTNIAMPLKGGLDWALIVVKGEADRFIHDTYADPADAEKDQAALAAQTDGLTFHIVEVMQ